MAYFFLKRNIIKTIQILPVKGVKKYWKWVFLFKLI